MFDCNVFFIFIFFILATKTQHRQSLQHYSSHGRILLISLLLIVSISHVLSGFVPLFPLFFAVCCLPCSSRDPAFRPMMPQTLMTDCISTYTTAISCIKYLERLYLCSTFNTGTAMNEIEKTWNEVASSIHGRTVL